MAGAGFKTFNTGDVLTASDVNTYLMQQTVMVFDDATARSTALGANVAEGMMSYLKDTNLTYRYDGSSWLSDAGATSPLTTKGDIWVYGTSDTRLPVGTNGYTLVSDSSETTGLKWAAAGGGMTSLSSGNLNGSNTITFNSISGSYNNLELHIPSYNLNGVTRMAVRVNNDSGSNYFGFYVRNRNNSFGSGVYQGTTYINADGEVTPNNDTNNGSVIFRFLRYAASDGRKVIEIVGHSNDTYVIPFYETFVWNGTQGAITRIDIITVGGQNFTAGSYILYGVK